MCFFSNVVLLRRIDSEYVNMSTGLEALAIVGPGEESKKKEILSPIQDHVVVEWGTAVGSGVNGIWVPLQVARGLALRVSYIALVSFFFLVNSSRTETDSRRVFLFVLATVHGWKPSSLDVLRPETRQLVPSSARRGASSSLLPFSTRLYDSLLIFPN